MTLVSGNHLQNAGRLAGMADVDLSVKVAGTGIAQATASLEKLTKQEQSARVAATALGKETKAAMAVMTSEANALRGTTGALQQTDKAFDSLRASVVATQRAYGQFAKQNVEMSASQRLTAFYASPAQAKQAVAQAVQINAAGNADIVADDAKATAQRQELAAARSSSLRAQGQLATAIWERELASMTPVQAATARLSKATQELATSTRAVNVAKARVAENPTIANYEAQTAAITRLTAAQRGLVAAQSGAKSTRNAAKIQEENRALQENTQLAAARARAVKGQGQLASAAWERELASMTPLAAATARLTKATQELGTATRSYNAATNRLSQNQSTANYNAQANAANRLATAQRGLVTSQENVARATKEARNERDFSNKNAFQSSYSYFIIAGLATKAATSIRDTGAAALIASAQMESAFSDVVRTTQGTDQQLDSLRAKLYALSTSTPLSFVDLSEIAAMGNQLGVAAKDIENFTTVMAEYSTISGQSADDVSTAFGRISNLTGLAASKYSNLASAITYVARTTVSTESSIQNTAKEITALSSGAGFSAQAIVGLAGALSSLAIPPERARGSLSLYFGALDKAVAEGGPKLEAFSTITGITADNLEKLVRQNKGQQVFTAFIKGLSNLDTVAKSSALDSLGLSTIRVSQTMRALSQNIPLVEKSFKGANTAFEQNTEIGRQWGIVQDRLSSKWAAFQNVIKEAAGAVGDKFAPAAKDLLGFLNGLIVSLTELE